MTLARHLLTLAQEQVPEGSHFHISSIELLPDENLRGFDQFKHDSYDLVIERTN
jgi:hypothetical protein